MPINKPFISFIGKPNITINANALNVTANANALNVTDIANAIPIITNSTKASDKGSDGQEMGTVSTATVWVESDFFCATTLTIEVRTNLMLTNLVIYSFYHSVMLFIHKKNVHMSKHYRKIYKTFVDDR